ncbi:hypothetical protein FRC03_006627 [Tulasnella sp. 419]|nr:hypothetical protein FRC03_006627 [Tulasnella sp. 419]
MTRAQRVLATAGVVAIGYALLFFSILPVPLLEPEAVDSILPVLPWWALVTFGAYCLGRLGWHVMTIRDCPEAYHELMSEISAAKNDLRAKGVTVD